MTACELCEKQQETEAYLCRPCTDTTGQQLAAFPHLYRNLAEELLPLGSNWPRGNGGHATQTHAPMPLLEEPLVLRGPGGIVGVLEDWRAALHTDRGWSPPKGEGSIEARIRAAVDGLTVNLPWIADRWPQAGLFAGELRDLYRNVTSITAPTERPGIRVGYCPAVYDGVLCGAVLNLPNGADTIACAWCRAEYPPRLWSWLRTVQDEMGKAS